MSKLALLYTKVHEGVFERIKWLDGLPPLLLRLYLAPVMIAAGLHKLYNFDDMVAWFGSTGWGLGLPAPALMVSLAIFAELIGGLALLVGLAVRWFAIPLLIAMAVAMMTVHWEHGWFAIAPGNPETSTAKPLADIGISAAQRSLENSEEVGRRVVVAKNLLKDHGNYSWITEKGSFVVLNNGIEFAATYIVMLLSLFFTGGGRYFSIDYWIRRYFWHDAEM